MSILSGKKILLGISGGIAAYKTANSQIIYKKQAQM
jgi:phosphopantothenoylcysteine synthetase/decarboxylase